MDLDQLQSVRDRERQTDRLQQLRDTFYEEAAAFVRDLRAERDEAADAAADPFDDARVNRLTDRIRTAEQTLEAIYEKRVGKVVKAATFAAADLPAEADGMTNEEDELFETLVAEIEANRAEVLGRLSDEGSGDREERVAPEETGAADGDGSDALGAADVMGAEPTDSGDQPPPPEPPAADPSTQPSDSTPAVGAGPDSGTESGPDPDPDSNPDPDSADGDDSGGETPTDDQAASNSEPDAPAGDAPPTETDVERQLVRITDDVGPILGVDDREYDLAVDDVVTLPAENARPLVDRGAAERLE